MILSGHDYLTVNKQIATAEIARKSSHCAVQGHSTSAMSNQIKSKITFVERISTKVSNTLEYTA